MWYNVYTTEYTTNHNPLVVYIRLTTGGMWYNVYTTEYTTNIFNHYNEESKKYWENQIWWQLNNLCK
jgi:predicted GIY-YIG superfamily endonuclease